MWLKKSACILLALVVLIMSAVPANAMSIASKNKETYIIPFATNSYNMSIPANTKALANMSFSLMVGETVTIKASYAPFSASVDFGLVDSDGRFYYFNATNGSIDKTLMISKSGRYTLQIRNNSNTAINVSGFVNY